MTALVLAGSVDVAAVLAARQRAVVAAESAALAAADAATWMSDRDPAEEAGRLTSANGAVLVSCACNEGSGQAVVTVEVRAQTRVLPGWAGARVRVTRTARPEPWVETWR